MKKSVSLNSKQHNLLKFIAKYRFVTAKNVATYFGLKSRGGVYEKLDVLIKAGFIAARYDKSYKLQYRPGAYYLTPKGLRKIQEHMPYITEAIIRGAYSDNNASDGLMQNSAELFEIAQSLTRCFPGMKVLTARQLGDIEYFPRPLPDLYLAHTINGVTERFFLYNFRDVKRYDIAIHSTIKKLIAYHEAETYLESGNEFPTVLFACHSATIERLAQRVMRNTLQKTYDSINTYTTSYQALTKLEHANDTIWTSLEDPDELLALDEI